MIRPNYAEIDLSNITHNISAIKRSLVPGTKFLAVIKDLETTDNIHVVNGYRTPDEVSADICAIVKGMI